MQKRDKVNSMAHGHDLARKALLALIILLPITVIYSYILVAGPQWDFMAHYLNGRTLYDYLTHGGVSVYAAFAGEYQNNLLYYFEPYREPLPTPMLAVFVPLGKELDVLAYITIVFAIYVFGAYRLGRELRIDALLMLTAFLNSYVIIYFFDVTSKEALSAAFVMLGLAYLLRKSPMAGLFFGLAGLSKYPALIFLPMIFLLWDAKKISYAAGLAFLVTLPWLLFNYYVWGSPLYSYLSAITISVTSKSYAFINLGAIAQVIAYPLVIAVLALLGYRCTRRKATIKRYPLYVMAMAIVLSFIGYVWVAPHNDEFTQARYAYLFSIALLIPATYLLSEAIRGSGRWERLRNVVPALAIVSLLLNGIGLCYFFSYSQSHSAYYYNGDNPDGLYAQAYSSLSLVGFGGCRAISDSWIPMVYSGYDVYSPFVTSYNPKLVSTLFKANSSVNITDQVLEREHYPIIVFKYPGVPESDVTGLANATLAYSTDNFSVYLPRDAVCVRDQNQ